MERLTQRDLRALLTFLQDCYAIRSFQYFIPRALSGLRSLVPCELASYSEMNPREESSWNVLDPEGFVTPEQESVFQQVMHQHPVLTYHLKTKDVHAYKISDFIGEANFHRLALFGDFYRTFGVEDDLSCALPVPAPVVIGIGMHRSRRSFTERDRLLANLVRPHLAQAWRNSKMLTRIEREVRLLGSALEKLQRGLVILARNRRVRLTTPLAQDWLHKYFGPANGLTNRLPPNLDRWVRHQESLLNGSDAPRVRTPLVVANSGGRLIARLVAGAEGGWLLFEEESAGIRPQALRPLGLTKRETEVLAWVAEGKTNAEIGNILSISPRTVQKHLEHIFTKLGVETRTAAAIRAQASLRTGI